MSFDASVQLQNQQNKRASCPENDRTLSLIGDS